MVYGTESAFSAAQAKLLDESIGAQGKEHVSDSVQEQPSFLSVGLDKLVQLGQDFDASPLVPTGETRR
jgi:hypothetical protein